MSSPCQLAPVLEARRGGGGETGRNDGVQGVEMQSTAWPNVVNDQEGLADGGGHWTGVGPGEQAGTLIKSCVVDTWRY